MAVADIPNEKDRPELIYKINLAINNEDRIENNFHISAVPPLQLNDLIFELNYRTEEINKIQELEDGWDGDDALSITELVEQNAVSFLSKLPFDFLIKLKKSDIYPSTYGTIMFEFFGGKLNVDVGNSKIAYYTSFHKSSIIPSHKTYNFSEIDLFVNEIVAIFNRFV